MPSTSPLYPAPQGGASLLLSHRPTPQRNLALVIGANKLAASRVFTLLDADAEVVVSCSSYGGKEGVDELSFRAERKEILLDKNSNVDAAISELLLNKRPSETEEHAWTSILSALGPKLWLICVTDSLSTPAPSSTPRPSSSLSALQKAAFSLRIPLNIADHPSLSDFSFPATHRFPIITSTPNEEQQMSPLVVALSTSSQGGCRLATRLKREIISKLPKNVGGAVQNVGVLRSLVRRRGSFGEGNEDDSILDSTTPLNTPVPMLCDGKGDELPVPEGYSEEEEKLRRMRYIAQISEYWSLDYLSKMDQKEMNGIWDKFNKSKREERTASTLSTGSTTSSSQSQQQPYSHHSLVLSSPPSQPLSTSNGRIYLLGSGPGHPSLLTLSTHHLLKHKATLILSDKLVPAEILSLIPSTTKLIIAKKFPGNSEGAQNELMALAIEGAQRGEVVVRLKQGDPFIFGRGGEEILYFRSKGFEPVVIPGISSCIAGPLMFGIPVTQRGVAESMILCTGVGRGGKIVNLPAYERPRTLVILMGVARLNAVLKVLMSEDGDGGQRLGAAYPPYMPIAIIERASSPDQRLIASTLDGIAETLEKAGEQRTPGMIVVGWSVLAMEGEGDVSVLDVAEDGEGTEEVDKLRVEKWLCGKSGIVREGLREEWDAFLQEM